MADLKKAWREATEYLAETGDPEMVEAIRDAMFATHDDICIDCHNADMRERCPGRKRLYAATKEGS